MNPFFVTLLTILILGLAILQLILFKWTDGWLWPVLHIALFIVSVLFLSTRPLNPFCIIYYIRFLSLRSGSY